ncbi:Berberine bridge enzyme [Heracleum sosnowskyi]|uniref:Berberine bridge enzyme n=1 Tax=Heracleum sosnowskyi TaxID=360622 RepID=A0AAD8IL08_9APIA|nr:Berberine bridge enzyme [Heracleum sosnowskyi]
MVDHHTKVWFILVSLVVFLCSVCADKLHSTSNDTDDKYQNFVQCLSTKFPNSTTHLYNNTSPEFQPLYQSMQQNTRWINSSPAPVFILTPFNEIEIQAAVTCSQSNGVKLRIKSGGHDYEGLSYRSNTSSAFVIIDMSQFRDIQVDVANEVAWAGAGATVGELYYAIAKESAVHGFPGGTAPSVGTGGQISGGGLGWLCRKYGLAADNVMDAHIVDASGHLLDRGIMGEDLFWAIRGGGGGSFGIITSWKIKLVQVPSIMTTFTKHKFLSENATALLDEWQLIAPTLPNNLVIRILARLQNQDGEKSVEISFNAVFQGAKSELMSIMNDRFPSLGLIESDCSEMPWVNTSILYWGAKQGNEYPVEDILNRTDRFVGTYKGKSDFVNTPIPTSAFQGIWDLFTEESGLIILEPLGGKMDEFSETDLPFPYRKGTLYNIQYLIHWQNNDQEQGQRSLEWINKIYDYMTPFVTSNPRGAYVNYRDLDLGLNQPQGKTSFNEAKAWGEKYFGKNFEKLCRVKHQVDPDDFFSHEQSIPPISTESEQATERAAALPPFKSARKSGRPSTKWHTGWS